MPDLHAEKGPSSLSLYEACPGYMPDDRPSPWVHLSDEGTAMHEACEKEDPDLLDNHELLYYSGAVNMGRDQMILDEEKQCVIDALKYTKEFFSDCAAVHKEKALSILPKTGCDFGTCDAYALKKDLKHAKAVDYKFGRIKVALPAHNSQVWAYVLGIFGLHEDIETVEFAIVSPRFWEHPKKHIFKRDDIPLLQHRVQNILDRSAHAQPDQYNKCEACRFCKRLPRCHKWVELIKNTLACYDDRWKNDKFADLDMESCLEALTDETLGLRMQALMAIEDFATKGKDDMNEYCMENAVVPESFTVRRVDYFRIKQEDLEDVIKEVAFKHKMGVEDAYANIARCIKSFTAGQVTKGLADAAEESVDVKEIEGMVKFSEKTRKTHAAFLVRARA